MPKKMSGRKRGLPNLVGTVCEAGAWKLMNAKRNGLHPDSRLFIQVRVEFELILEKEARLRDRSG